jgi:hypothetical protein
MAAIWDTAHVFSQCKEAIVDRASLCHAQEIRLQPDIVGKLPLVTRLVGIFTSFSRGYRNCVM